MNNNFDDYLNAILEHYEIVKNGKDADLLQKPTPGNLKKLCIQLLENGLNNQDKTIFDSYFLPTGEQTLLGITRTVNADSRLRTPSDFLRTGQGLKDNRKHANLVAVLVGFEPRPFLVFQNAARTKNEREPFSLNDEKSTDIKKENTVAKPEKKTSHQNTIERTAIAKPKTSRNKKIALTTTASLLFFGMSGFIYHKATEEHCMVWKEDHFEKIDCEQSAISTIKGVEKIYPYNEALFEQEKIVPTDTTTFFKNGKSAVYYLQTDKKYEFFKQPGPHPVYQDRNLRRVTNRIISRWKASEK